MVMVLLLMVTLANIKGPKDDPIPAPGQTVHPQRYMAAIQLAIVIAVNCGIVAVSDFGDVISWVTSIPQ